MNIRRDGNVLFITDNGFYEPPLVPTVAQRRRAKFKWSIAFLATVTLIGIALAGANKLQRFL